MTTAFMLWGHEECHWCEHRWLVVPSKPGDFGLNALSDVCGGSVAVSRSKQTTQDVNGFLPRSVYLFGLINPANLMRRNRTVAAAEARVEAMVKEEGACTESQVYVVPGLALRNFTTIEARFFDPEVWTGELPPSPPVSPIIPNR
jgi:hypothetical protein